MVQSLAASSGEAARTAVKADHQKRNREAWNLPRASVPVVFPRRYRDGLDWDDFRDLYHPDGRRHDFKAVAAYGVYKNSRGG